jgi:hypothetical protein
MQIKTIRRNIDTKLNDWLSSIDNPELVEELRKNVLVSGGAIASMLLNENVNDYDIYINDIEVLINLCRYYTSDFSDEIQILDGRYYNAYMEEFKTWVEIDDKYKSARKISIENLKADQIKLWFENKEGMFKPEYTEEEKAKLNYKPVFFSPNAISLSNDIQIVIRFHGDNEAIHKTFDFVHATNYFTFEQGLVTNISALESILAKQLKYNGSLYPITSVIRMKKFLKRGWNCNAGEILKMAFQISELYLKDPNVLEEQLIGVDIAYFAILIKILRGVSANKYTSAYLNTVIDKVFGDVPEEN